MRGASTLGRLAALAAKRQQNVAQGERICRPKAAKRRETLAQGVSPGSILVMVPSPERGAGVVYAALSGLTSRQTPIPGLTPWAIISTPLRGYHRLALCLTISVILVVIAIPSLAAQQDMASSVLQQVGIDQRLGAVIDLNLAFHDESGRAVRLGDFFHGKPVILAPVYYTCSSLCPMTLNSLVQSLRVLKFDAGAEFEVVAFSFDPNETPAMAAEAKAHYVRDYNRPNTSNGWHFLTGNEASIRALTDGIGFHYVWDANSTQWAHATAVIVTTPEGKLAQYFYGLEFSARDLRLSLVQASSEKIGSLADRVLLYCYHYDPATGKYGLVVIRSIRIFGTLTALALFSFMFLMFRRDARMGRA